MFSWILSNYDCFGKYLTEKQKFKLFGVDIDTSPGIKPCECDQPVFFNKRSTPSDGSNKSEVSKSQKASAMGCRKRAISRVNDGLQVKRQKNDPSVRQQYSTILKEVTPPPCGWKNMSNLGKNGHKTSPLHVLLPKWLSADEKQELRKQLSELSKGNLPPYLRGFLKEIGVNCQKEGRIELDIDAFSEEILFKLKRIIRFMGARAAKDDKADVVKIQQQEEGLKRQQNEEKARIEAKVIFAKLKTGREQAREAELKKQREQEREAARLALQQIERTVEFNDHIEILKDFQILTHCSLSEQYCGFEETPETILELVVCGRLERARIEAPIRVTEVASPPSRKSTKAELIKMREQEREDEHKKQREREREAVQQFPTMTASENIEREKQKFQLFGAYIETFPGTKSCKCDEPVFSNKQCGCSTPSDGSKKSEVSKSQKASPMGCQKRVISGVNDGLQVKRQKNDPSLRQQYSSILKQVTPPPCGWKNMSNLGKNGHKTSPLHGLLPKRLSADEKQELRKQLSEESKGNLPPYLRGFLKEIGVNCQKEGRIELDIDALAEEILLKLKRIICFGGTRAAKNDKVDAVKTQQQEERPKRQQNEEKARIEAKVRFAKLKKGREREREAELKKQREREREAARLALQQIERTVEFDDHFQILKDFQMLSQCSISEQYRGFEAGPETILQLIACGRSEKARIDSKVRFAKVASRKSEEAELKKGRDREREAELKKQRERERKVARLALQKIVRTVEFDDNIQVMKDFEMLIHTLPSEQYQSLEGGCEAVLEQIESGQIGKPSGDHIEDEVEEGEILDEDREKGRYNHESMKSTFL